MYWSLSNRMENSPKISDLSTNECSIIGVRTMTPHRRKEYRDELSYNLTTQFHLAFRPHCLLLDTCSAIPFTCGFVNVLRNSYTGMLLDITKEETAVIYVQN